MREWYERGLTINIETCYWLSSSWCHHRRRIRGNFGNELRFVPAEPYLRPKPERIAAGYESFQNRPGFAILARS